MKFVFWQNIISPHQAGLLTALQQRPDVEVTLVVQEEMPEWRLDTGWKIPEVGDVELLCAPPSAAIRELACRAGDHTHVFSGLGAYDIPRQALRQIARQEIPSGGRGLVLVAAEQLDNRGVKGVLRREKYRRLVRSFSGVVDGYLGYGLRAGSDFQKFGVPAKRTFPFAYFLAEDAHAGEAFTTNQGHSRIMFIGRMEALKRVDLILTALSRLPDLAWHLDLVGDGPMRDEWEEHSRQLGIHGRVSWLGRLPNDEARRRLRSSDVLVLPSEYDGWGGVVNEALLAGARVIASSAVGASVLLVRGDLGTRFRSGSVSALTRELSREIRRGPQRPQDRALVIDWARQCISPTRGADYLLGIVNYLNDHTRRMPLPPWEAH